MVLFLADIEVLAQNKGEKEDLFAEHDEDDDDSDLDPIESDMAPTKSDIKYLRHFLEKMPEMKQHSQVSSAFHDLPRIIKHQLTLEHPQIGKDLVRQVFLWENEFDDAVLDECRKNALVTVLNCRPEGNADHLCQLFHEDHVQSFRKNLILDVFARATKIASLKDLQVLCNACFRLLLIREE